MLGGIYIPELVCGGQGQFGGNRCFLSPREFLESADGRYPHTLSHHGGPQPSPLKGPLFQHFPLNYFICLTPGCGSQELLRPQLSHLEDLQGAVVSFLVTLPSFLGDPPPNDNLPGDYLLVVTSFQRSLPGDHLPGIQFQGTTSWLPPFWGLASFVSLPSNTSGGVAWILRAPFGVH